MNSIRVDRKELILAITKNRNEHRDLFLKAQEGFRKRVIEELDQMITEARSGKSVKQYVGLVAPEDHTVEYDRAIDMLNWSQDETMEISAQDFLAYVRNEWAWFGNTTAVNTTYASGHKMGSSR